MSNTPSVPDRNDAPTNGWDAVFAINFNHANTALTSGWSEVNDKAKNVDQKAPDTPGFEVKGVFDPWQFTIGGDGKNIRMSCTFQSGSYTAEGKSYDLAPKGGKAAEVVIEVGMEWVPDPNQKSFVLGDGTVPRIIADLDNNTIDSDLKTAFTKNGLSLTASAAARVVQKGLQWHLTDGSASFYIFYTVDKDSDKFLTVYKYEKSWANNLKLLAEAVSKQEPAVSVITIANNPASGIAAAVLPQLLSVWFNTNIGEFNHVFAVLDLAPGVSKDDKYAWAKPTATSYAVTDQGSLDTSVFGVLTMAQNNIPGDNHEVSPYAIPAGPDSNGANAGFLITGADFVKNMLLPGAQLIFNNAPATAFRIVNDHLTVQNSADMIWGKFMMDNKKKGSIAGKNYGAALDGKKLPSGLVSDMAQWLEIDVDGYSVEVTTTGSQWLLTTGKVGSKEYILDKSGNELDVYEATIIKIKAGDFKMSLNHSYVEIEFVGLTYPYSSDFDVSVNYTEQVVLGLKQEGGKQIFWFDQVLKNMVVSVKKTQSAITREIVEGAVVGALSLVALAGPIIDGLAGAAEIGEVTEEGGTAIIDGEAFADAQAMNPEEAAADDAAAGSSAAEQSGGKLTRIKNAFNTPRWKFVGAITAVAGAITGVDQVVSAIIENAATKQWQKVPGFDDFANAVIKPYSFPDIPAFDLKSAWLAGSLQVGLKAKQQ